MRYNTDFSRPTYIHSHIRTFEKTIEKAFDIKVVTKGLQDQAKSLANRVERLEQLFRLKANELERIVDPRRIATGKLFEDFQEAKESWTRLGADIPRKADLVDKARQRVAGLEQMEDVAVGNVVEAVADLFGESFPAEVEKQILKNFNKMITGDGKVPASPDTKILDYVPNFFKNIGSKNSIDQALNRTLKHYEVRKKEVAGKYEDDKQKLRDYVALLNRSLATISESPLTVAGVERIWQAANDLLKFKTTRTNKKGDIIEVDLNEYDQKTYGILLTTVNLGMGHLMEAAVAHGVAAGLLEAGAETEVDSNTVHIVATENQREITSDILATISGIAVGYTVKSNLKGVFQHNVPFHQATKYFYGGEDVRDKLIYFLANYQALQKWNVERDAPAELTFEEDWLPENIGRQLGYKDTYLALMQVLHQLTLINGLLGSLFSDLGETAEDILNNADSIPLVLVVFDKGYYTHDVLAAVKGFSGSAAMAEAEGGVTRPGFTIHMHGINPKGDLGEMWSKKYLGILGLMALDIHDSTGYTVLKEIVASHLPSGLLSGRITIRLNTIFKE